jgi:hypothetical protein
MNTVERVNKLTKKQLLSEMARLSKEQTPSKGTYIKTLKHEEIFDEPTNKTSTIYPIKDNKGKKMLIPIEDEPIEKEAKGLMTEEELTHLISVLNNPYSKEILRRFLKQERNRQDTSSSSSDSD